MGRAEAARGAARRGGLQSARRARPARSAVELPAGRHACSTRSAPAALLQRHPAVDSRRAGGRRLGPQRRRSRPVLRDGDRVEIYRPLLVDPKEARRRRATRSSGRRQAPTLSRPLLAVGRDHVAGRAWSRRRAACRRGTRARPSRWCGRSRMPLSSVRSWALARAQLSALAAATRSLLGLVLRRHLALGLLALGFELGVGRLGRRRRRRGAPTPAPMRPTPRGGRAGAGAARAGARPRKDVLVGHAGGRRQVAVLDAAALVAPLPLRLGGQRRRARARPRRRASDVRTTLSSHHGPARRRSLQSRPSVAASPPFRACDQPPQNRELIRLHPYNSAFASGAFPCAFSAKRSPSTTCCWCRRSPSVLPRDTNLATPLSRNIRLNLPLVSAAMDTVTEARLAIAMAQEGGIGIVHKNLHAEAAGGRGGAGQALRVGRAARPDHGHAGDDGARGDGAVAASTASPGFPVLAGQDRGRHRHQPRPALRDAPRRAGARDHDAARAPGHGARRRVARRRQGADAQAQARARAGRQRRVRAARPDDGQGHHQADQLSERRARRARQAARRRRGRRRRGHRGAGRAAGRGRRRRARRRHRARPQRRRDRAGALGQAQLSRAST